jgi:O-antigen/teichoic acid export membrane protein
MGGRPASHTFLMASTVLVNVAGNAVLIPSYGLLGAAAATAVSMVASVLVLRWLASSELGVRI